MLHFVSMYGIHVYLDRRRGAAMNSGEYPPPQNPQQPQYYNQPTGAYQPPNNPKQSFWRRKVGCMPMWLLLGLIGLFVLIGLVNGITTGGKGVGNDSATPTTAGTV